MSAIDFTVPGQPVAKGRPKFSRQGGMVHVRTPEKTANYETLVKLAAGAAMGGNAPMQGPLSLMLRLYVQIPKSVTKRDRVAIAEGRFLPTKKPDVDNCLKAIADAMNGIVYDDDAQLVTVMVVKQYSDTPRAEVGVIELVERAETEREMFERNGMVFT
jgi:Holliday junction resolvase RusA-like endonuclease